MPHNTMQCLGSWAGDVALELSTVQPELRSSLLPPVWCGICGVPYEGSMHTPTKVVETCYNSNPGVWFTSISAVIMSVSGRVCECVPGFSGCTLAAPQRPGEKQPV